MATTLNSGLSCRLNPLSHSQGVSSQVKRWPEVTIGTRSMPSRPGHSRASSLRPCRSNSPSLACAITALGMAFGAETEALEHRAVGEHEERGRFVVRPGEIVVMLCHEPGS